MLLQSDPFLLFFFSCLLLAGCELVYFRIADSFNIIDKPNLRSSHTIPTIRGGGIVFIIAIMLWYLFGGFMFPKMLIGALLVAFISFMDDIREQPPGLRSLLQFIALVLVLWEVDFFHHPWWLVAAALIVILGTVNAFNFMDGINGITGIYALSNLLTFIAINEYVAPFTSTTLIVIMLSAVVVFLFFNFRKKARCFAGDVGSVTLAYVQIFLLLQLIESTMYFGWVLFFLVFGIDSIVTILFRLKRKENIFKPHRTHLYQYLANEMHYPHRLVSVIYGMVQGIVNILIIFIYKESVNMVAIVVLGVLYTITYLMTRHQVLNSVIQADLKTKL